MIDALDLALARLLQDPAAPTEVRDAEVSFEPLDRTYRPAQPTVNLFLAGVQQALELRGSVPVPVHTPDGYALRPAPLRLDCRYLVTAWASNGNTPAQRVADEHRLLAGVLAWLGSTATLPAATLGPRLSDQPVPIRLTVGLPHPERELVDLWSALGVQPRAAVWLSAVLALTSGEDEPFGPAVTDVDLVVSEGGGPATHSHVLGGVVRDADGPLAAAQVVIRELGRHVGTDDDGVFRLRAVPEGTYRLDVSAPEHLDATRTVHAPTRAGDDLVVELAPRP